MTQHQSNEWQQARKSATTMPLFPRHIMLVGPSFVQSCAWRQNGVHIKQPQADRVTCACKIDLRRGREAHHSGFVLYDDAPFPGCDSLPAGCACLFQHLNPLCLFQGLRWEKNWIIPSLTSIAEFSICCLHPCLLSCLSQLEKNRSMAGGLKKGNGEYVMPTSLHVWMSDGSLMHHTLLQGSRAHVCGEHIEWGRHKLHLDRTLLCTLLLCCPHCFLHCQQHHQL